MENHDTVAAVRTRPQHIEALERANRVRLARAGLKRDVSAGRRRASEIVGSCPWEAETMPLGELLQSQRRWGKTRTRKFLSQLGLGENKRLGTLTERQRNLVTRALAAKEAEKEMLGADLVERQPEAELVTV